jgi:hypothetical protein
MLPWVIAGVALAAALASWMRTGRVARKLDALNKSYWELRYDFTRLRSQVTRLDPGDHEPQEAPASPPPGQLAFVPLSSIKRKTGS